MLMSCYSLKKDGGMSECICNLRTIKLGQIIHNHHTDKQSICMCKNIYFRMTSTIGQMYIKMYYVASETFNIMRIKQSFRTFLQYVYKLFISNIYICCVFICFIFTFKYLKKKL